MIGTLGALPQAVRAGEVILAPLRKGLNGGGKVVIVRTVRGTGGGSTSTGHGLIRPNLT